MPDVIDASGYRIDNERNNDTRQLAQDFTGAIENTKKTIEGRGGQVPQDATFVVVEQGDCLWTIAGEYGVNPTTLINDNKQFEENPDLIHAGQIVVVRTPNTIDESPTTQDPAKEAALDHDAGEQTPDPRGTAATMGDPKLDQIQKDGQELYETCSNEARQALQASIAAYLGGVTATDADTKINGLKALDFGEADTVIDAEIPNAVSYSINNPAQPNGPYRTPEDADYQAFLADYLSTLPPGERQAAVDSMMDYSWSETTNAKSEFIHAARSLGYVVKV